MQISFSCGIQDGGRLRSSHRQWCCGRDRPWTRRCGFAGWLLTGSNWYPQSLSWGTAASAPREELCWSLPPMQGQKGKEVVLLNIHPPWAATLTDSRRGVYCCFIVQGEKSLRILGKNILKYGVPSLWQSLHCHITSTLQQADGSTQITGSIAKVWNPVLFMYQQPLTSWGRGAEQWDGRHTISCREGSVQDTMTNIFVREKIHSGKQIWSEQVLITHNYIFFLFQWRTS